MPTCCIMCGTCSHISMFHKGQSSLHYDDATLALRMASQLAGNSINCSTVWSGKQQRKLQSSALLSRETDILVIDSKHNTLECNYLHLREIPGSSAKVVILSFPNNPIEIWHFSQSVFWVIYNVFVIIIHHGVSVQKPPGDKLSPLGIFLYMAVYFSMAWMTILEFDLRQTYFYQYVLSF